MLGDITTKHLHNGYYKIVEWKDNRLDVRTVMFVLIPRTQKSIFDFISSAENRLKMVTFNSSSHYLSNEDADTAHLSAFVTEDAGMAKSRSLKFVRQPIILLQCDKLDTVIH